MYEIHRIHDFFPNETGTYTEEINKTCQQLIRDNLQWCNLVTSRFRPAPCMFGEVEGCVPTTAIRSDDDFMTMFRKINTCKLISTQWCYMHNKCCPVLGPDAAVDFNCAGLPCWDYSMAGNRKQEEGETRRVFIGYAAQHCFQRTPLLLVENVKASGLKVCVHVCQLQDFLESTRQSKGWLNSQFLFVCNYLQTEPVVSKCKLQ